MVLHIEAKYKPGQVIHGVFASFMVLAIMHSLTGTEYRLKNGRTGEVSTMSESDITLI